MLLPAAVTEPTCGRMIVPSGSIGVSNWILGIVNELTRITSPTLSR